MEELRDHHAERMIISIALHGRTDEFLALPPGAFDHWIADSIAVAMRTILNNGKPLDLPVVTRAIMSVLGTGARGQEVCTALAGMFTMYTTGEAAPYYAERLQNLYTARHFATQMTGFVNKMTYAAVNDDPVVAKRAFTEAREAIDEAERGVMVAEAEVMSAQDFMDLPTTAHDWLVPDLFEKTDRLILTGLEGTGKSILLAQLACTIAAGLHPFVGSPMPRRDYRTMIIDCENSPQQIQRRMRTITPQVDALRAQHGLEAVSWKEVLKIVSRPEGIAINDTKEYARLDHMIDSVAPDLVVMGPLYKMSKLDYRDEQAAKDLCDTLDSLRVRHQFALVTEAHTGHATDAAGQRSARPLGSSLFLRWPEFGLGLLPAEGHEGDEHPALVNVRRWRGSREERNWPFQLAHGDELPWVPSDYYRSTVPDEPSTAW
jgi:replicative DNA helicase